MEMSRTTFDGYLKRILSVFEASQHKVLLKGLDEGPFRRMIPKASQIQTFCDDDPYWLYSYVVGKELIRFIKILDRYRDHAIRIHGALYGLCTKVCAEQVYYYVYHGMQWVAREDGKVQVPLENRSRTFIDLEKRGAFAGSSIRYGFTLGSWLAQVRPPTEELPFGCINYQLSDERTSVIREEPGMGSP